MSDEKVTLGPAPLLEGEMKGYAVGKRNVLIVRYGGKVRAMDDWCNHAGCLLSGGRIEGAMVICPCHEIGFDLVTGKNATSPGVCDDQPVFRCEEEEGQVVVYGFPDQPVFRCEEEDGQVVVYGFPDHPLPPPDEE